MSPPPASASAAGHAGKSVVVCGGGVIGACTAYFLAQNGAAHVTVVEKSSIACAASGKAAGFLALDLCDDSPLGPLARASFNLHRTLANILNGPQSYGYRPLHALSLSATSGGGAAAALPPWVDGPTVGPARTIGTAETTGQVHPRLFTRTLLAAAAAEHSVEVVIGEVEQVEVNGGRATGVVVAAGGGRKQVITADAVVLALGPWSSRNPIVSALCSISAVKLHSIVLRPSDPDAFTPHAIFLRYLEPGIYPRPNGEVYFCGFFCEAELPDDPEEIFGDRDSIRMLHKTAGDASSYLREGEVDVEAEQACFMPCSEDGLPVIGEVPGVPGCYVATGHGGWGILNGPATGAALAELILLGGSTTVDLKPFSPSRFLEKHSKDARAMKKVI